MTLTDPPWPPGEVGSRLPPAKHAVLGGELLPDTRRGGGDGKLPWRGGEMRAEAEAEGAAAVGMGQG